MKTSQNTKEVNGLAVERRKLTDLVKANWNPRKITTEQQAALQRSLTEFGTVEPIVINRVTGNVVGGHQRLDALLANGETETDILVGEWSAEQEKALNIALNKISGEFDVPKLSDLLTELQDVDFDLELTGFSGDEIERMLSTPAWGGAGEQSIDQETFYMSFTLTVEENDICQMAMNKAREIHNCKKPKIDYHSSEIFVALCREYAGA